MEAAKKIAAMSEWEFAYLLIQNLDKIKLKAEVSSHEYFIGDKYKKWYLNFEGDLYSSWDIIIYDYGKFHFKTKVVDAIGLSLIKQDRIALCKVLDDILAF